MSTNVITRLIKSYSLSVLVFFLGFHAPAKAQTSSPDSLTLQQAIQTVLTNQPSLDEVEAQVQASEAKIDQAKSGYYPQVDIESSYNYRAPVSSLEFNGQNFQVRPKNNYDAHLAAWQMIYDFGQTKENIALARSQTLTAKQKEEMVKWTISYYAAKTFYSDLYLHQSIGVVEDQLSTLHEDLKIAKKKRKNGSATDYDVLSIKVRIGEQKNRKLDLMDEQKKTQIRLRNLFGWAPDREINLKGALDIKDEKSLSDLTQIYAYRPDYNILQQKKEVLQHSSKLRSLSDRPRLIAGAAAGFRNGYQPDVDEILGNYNIGLQLQVPIFNGNKTDYETQEVQANIHVLEAKTRSLRRDIQQDVEQAKADVETGKKKLETTDLQIRQAKEQLRLAKLRYKNGVITNTDLLAAETALTRARFQKVTTTYNILLSQYDLKKAMGEKIWVASN